MLDANLVEQGNTGLKRFSATPSTQPMTLNSAAMNPQGQYSLGSGTGISSIAKTSPGTSGQPNDSSLTNSYLRALKTQQGATAAAQSLSGVPVPDPNKSATQWTPEQQKLFQSMIGSMTGTPNGLNTMTPATSPTTPTATALPNPNSLVAGDNSRFANDPFKTNTNALR
jgi:hypothetical protein